MEAEFWLTVVVIFIKQVNAAFTFLFYHTTVQLNYIIHKKKTPEVWENFGQTLKGYMIKLNQQALIIRGLILWKLIFLCTQSNPSQNQ